MWIEKKTNSQGVRYAYCERYTLPNGQKRRATVTLNNNTTHAKKQATILLQEKVQKALAKFDEEETHSQRFYTVAKDWQAYKDVTTKETTNKSRANYVNKLLQMVSSDTLLTDITPIQIEEFCNRIYYTEGYSYAYSKAVLYSVKSIYRYARKKRLIGDIQDILDISIKQKPITIEDIKSRDSKLLSSDELKQLYDGLAKEHKRISLLAEFMALTGLRCGECLALREEDYNRFNKSININGTLRRFGNALDPSTRTSPKNSYSIRDVSLSDRAIEILNLVILENKKSTLSKSYYKKSTYIWTTAKGCPLNIQFINRIFKRVPVNGRTITTHALRHTHISMLAEMGIPLKAIMARVGHNDPNTTLKIYTHVTQSAKDEIIHKLNRIG